MDHQIKADAGTGEGEMNEWREKMGTVFSVAILHTTVYTVNTQQVPCI